MKAFVTGFARIPQAKQCSFCTTGTTPSKITVIISGGVYAGTYTAYQTSTPCTWLTNDGVIKVMYGIGGSVASIEVYIYQGGVFYIWQQNFSGISVPYNGKQTFVISNYTGSPGTTATTVPS